MPYGFALLMMDVFLTILQARSNIKASSKEYSWLQSLFEVVSDYLYKPSFFNVECEDLCLDILDIILARNENKLPIDHTVLSPSSLKPFQGGNYFTGQFGQTSKSANHSEPTNNDVLEKQPLILLGFLTDTPTSDKPGFPESGFLYLEDSKNAIICETNDECGLEKHMLNNLFLLTKWNYISVKFPIAVFQSQKGDSKHSSFLKYIEVAENMICIEKQERPAVPKALSVQEYYSKKDLIKPNVERINIYGCLKSLSSQSSLSLQEPYFLTQIYSPETQDETTLAFQGFRFASWYHLMNIGETYVFTNVVKTTMNEGQPSERTLLATISRKAEIFKVDPEIYEENQNKDSELREPEGDETSEKQIKRKRSEFEKEQQKENSKRCRKKQECSGFHFKKSDIYTASSPICYEGVITDILQANIGLYEIDGKFRLFTHYSPCKKLGCGMRTGATVVLYHIHLCKLGQKVLGLACCHLSTIRITKHSMLNTKFQAFFPNASNDWRKLRQLPLVAFCDVLELRENLSNMFQGLLREKDILGAKMCWCDRVRPCILSHLVNLESWMSLSSRDGFDEFFSDPHRCIVTNPVNEIKIPNLWTLKDLLSSVDTLESNRIVNFQAPKGQYAWNYHEITQEELSEDLILCGWISYGKASGKLYLCNANATVLCLITESGSSQDFHKCDIGCLTRRHDRKTPISPCSDEIKTTCPLPQTLHLGAIVKITSFKIVVETFRGLGPVGKEIENRNDLLRKIYLVFSARDAVIIGKIPGFNRADVSEKKNMADPGKSKDEGSINRSSCRLVFRVKHKELPALQFKNSSHSLAACVHGYILKSSHGLISKTGSEKQPEIIKFTNNCHWLQTLHSGKIYAVIENDHEDKNCHIKEALQGKSRVIITTSNVKVEEIDPDEYKNCIPTEQLVEIDSVRSYLSRWENRNPKGKFESTKFLVSLRGVILTRETVVSMENECPSPDTPNDHLFLPHYGPIPKDRASVLSLGHQYLGQRTMVLTVRDVLTADTVKIYLNFSTRPYPLGLLPEAVVTFEHMQHHISKQGNVYLSFEACSGISIESLAIGMSLNATRSQENSHMGRRQIVEYINFQKSGKLVCTLSYISCRIVAVQKVDLRWICSVCGLSSRNACGCHAREGKQTLLLHAKAQCVIEDGTGEAMVFIEGEELVKKVLFVKDSTWISITNLSKSDGQVSYSRGAYWKNGQACSLNKAEQTLNSTITSPKMYRRIKLLCRQFSVGNIEEQKKETRKIWVDRRDFVTEVSPKIMLNVLEIHEINYRKELRTMISDHEKRLLND